MDEVTFRRFRQADHDAVLSLHEKALRDVGSYVEGMIDSDLGHIVDSYIDVGGEFLVGDLDGDIIAMGGLRPITGYLRDFIDGSDDGVGEIKRMRVDPNFQRKGIGQAIYASLESRAGDLGFRELALDTDPENEGVCRFYEHQGFDLYRTTNVTIDGVQHSLAIYRKPIQ